MANVERVTSGEPPSTIDGGARVYVNAVAYPAVADAVVGATAQRAA